MFPDEIIFTILNYDDEARLSHPLNIAMMYTSIELSAIRDDEMELCQLLLTCNGIIC